MKHTTQLLEDRIKGGFTFEIGGALDDGWRVFKTFGLGFIGYLLLVGLILGVLAIIPIIGSFASMILMPAFFAGFYSISYKILRKESFRFSNFFDGFKIGPGIFLIGIVKNIIIFAILLFSIFPLVLPELSSLIGINIGLGTASLIPFIIGMIVIFYLSIAWMYAVPILVHFKVSFWQALEYSRRLTSKNLGLVFLFLLSMVGVVILFYIVIFLLAVTQIVVLPLIAMIVGWILGGCLYFTSVFSSFYTFMKLDSDAELDIMDHLIEDQL